MPEPADVDLGSDDLVEHLARARNPDTGEFDAVALIGFLGRGADGHARLYQDHELKVWVDIPDGEIIHRRRIPSELGTFGGRSVIWVDGSRLRTTVEQELVDALAAQFQIGPLAAKNLLPRTLDDALDQLMFKPPTTRCTPKCP